jgi:hypothetical protein
MQLEWGRHETIHGDSETNWKTNRGRSRDNTKMGRSDVSCEDGSKKKLYYIRIKYHTFVFLTLNPQVQLPDYRIHESSMPRHCMSLYEQACNVFEIYEMVAALNKNWHQRCDKPDDKQKTWYFVIKPGRLE